MNLGISSQVDVDPLGVFTGFPSPVGGEAQPWRLCPWGQEGSLAPGQPASYGEAAAGTRGTM